MVALGEVATIERNVVDPGAFEPATAYLGLEHIESGGRIVSYDTVGRAQIRSAKFTFGPGHVLFGKLRPYLGKVALPSLDGLCSTDILPIRPGKDLDRRYLAHFLRQPSVVAFAASRATGANLPRLSPAALAAFEIPLPELARQRRIAAVLDQANDLRLRRCRSLALLGDLQQSVFLDLFADLTANDTVADVASRTRTGPFGSQLLHSEFVSEGIAVLGLDNVVANEFQWVERRYITAEKYEQLHRYRVHPGDVLISIMGTVGRCVVVPDDIPLAINTKHICAITPDPVRVLPQFLRAAFLWHPESRAYLRRQTKGAIMDGLNMGIIRAMPVPLPSIGAQLAFVRRLAAIRKQAIDVSRSLTQLDALFASLQSRAFSGEPTLSAS